MDAAALVEVSLVLLDELLTVDGTLRAPVTPSNSNVSSTVLNKKQFPSLVIIAMHSSIASHWLMQSSSETPSSRFVSAETVSPSKAVLQRTLYAAPLPSVKI